MPRKPTVRSNSDFYHVTGRSNNKDFWYLPTVDVWEILCKELELLKSEFNLIILSFVVMDNHFHLLMKTPEEDIDRVMYFFMKKTTLTMQKRSGRINKIYGGRYKGSVIKSDSYLLNVYKYIYRNPVKGGICEKAESYPYSTLYYKQLKEPELPFQMDDFSSHIDFYKFDMSDELKWINQTFTKEESESIQCGLRKSVFSYKKDKGTGKVIVPAFNPPFS